MKPTPIKAIASHQAEVGSRVRIAGWVRSKRTSRGGFSFLDLHDGSCFHSIQAIVDDSLANYQEVLQLGAGCAVEVTGLVADAAGRRQDREVRAEAVAVVGTVMDPESYPIAKKRHTLEYLRGVAHLRPRTNTFGAIARVRHALARAMHGYFNEHGFVWVNTPIITANDCEGAGDLFRVSALDLARREAGAGGAANYSEDFFGRETWLTVSGQLNVEAYCLALSKVYTFGPTFRAENSNTSRHLAEFWMVEPEIAFADLHDNAALAEDFLKAVLKDLLESCADDMAFFAERIDKRVADRLENVVTAPFERLSYTEAVAILERSGEHFEFPVRWGLDLKSEHERYLTEKHVGGPLIVVDYPKDLKAFYMRMNDDERTVAAMDVLVPGVGEIIGGSQREERLDQLDARLPPGVAEDLWWYRDLRRYGSAPHAGFGLGLERLVLYATGMENIRDAIPFPRARRNAAF